jgi:hypothetical protein
MRLYEDEQIYNEVWDHPTNAALDEEDASVLKNAS